MVEVGSMEIVGLFKDMNLFSSLAKVKTELRSVTEHVKSTTTEMFRMTGQTGMLAKVLGLIGVGGFTALLMTMPRVSAHLERIHTYMELIALIMDETLGPQLEWIADKFEDLYHWFKDLDPEAQKLITWATEIGILFLGGLGIATVLGKLGLLKTALLGIGGSTGAGWLAAAAVGALVGELVVLAMDEAGVLDYISDLGEGFREVGEAAKIAEEEKFHPFYDTLVLVGGGFALIVDSVRALVGLKEWNELNDNINVYKASFDRLWYSIDDVVKKLLEFVGIESKGTASPDIYTKDVGGIASYSGLHYLKAGETVSMKGTEVTEGSGGPTVINNNYDGAQFILTNGLDIDDFIDLTSRKQAQKAAWGAF